MCAACMCTVGALVAFQRWRLKKENRRREALDRGDAGMGAGGVAGGEGGEGLCICSSCGLQKSVFACSNTSPLYNGVQNAIVECVADGM